MKIHFYKFREASSNGTKRISIKLISEIYCNIEKYIEIYRMNKKKKILFVITRSHWGGAQRYLYDIATNLSQSEYEITVVAGAGGELIEKLENAGVPVLPLRTSRNVRIIEEIKTFFNLIRIFKKEKPDIVHLNSSKIGVLGSFAAWLTGVPKIIFTAHGWAFNENRSFFAQCIILFFSWLSALFQNHIICVSEYDYKSAKKLPFVHKKCVIIKNAIQNQDFATKNEARLFFKKEKSISAPKNALWIGSISELTKNKGLIYAIRGLSHLQEYPWIFIIIGEGEERNTLEQAIEKYGLQNRVFLAGHIQNASHLLKAFDILTLTSIKEGFPYVLLEAAHAGIPVVAAEAGGIPEIIKSGENGFLTPPKNEFTTAKYLKELITNKKLREYFAKELRSHTAKEFIFTMTFERTTELYK